MILSQKQMAMVLGVTPETVRRYERLGMIKRIPGRPGAWYNTAYIDENFLGKKLHLAQEGEGEGENENSDSQADSRTVRTARPCDAAAIPERQMPLV